MATRSAICSVVVALGVLSGSSIHGEEQDRLADIVYPQPKFSVRRAWYKELVEQKPYSIRFAVGHSDNWNLPMGLAKDNGDLASLPFQKLLNHCEMLTVRATAGESGMVTTKSGVNVFYRLEEVDEVPRLELLVEDRDEPRVEAGIPSFTTRYVDTRLEPTLSEWHVAASLRRGVLIKETRQQVRVSWNVAVRVDRHAADEAQP